MANENTVFNCYAFTDKCMTGNLAALTYSCVLLHLNKGPDLAIVANLAAIQINELRERNSVAKLYVRRNGEKFIHR